MSEDTKDLEKRIQILEKELEEKNSLLLIYKEELQRMNERLGKILRQVDNDLALATSLQSLLVPTEIGDIKGFHFSSKFETGGGQGGDYFEIVQHEDKYKFAVIMSSSSAYSLSALFMSVLLKLTHQLAKKEGLNPQEFCLKVQEQMQAHMKNEDAFSLVYAEFDRKKNRVTYSGCGEICALRWNSKSNEVDTLQLESQKLQPTQSLELPLNSFRYQVGDRILFSSPGFVGQKNTKDHVYGSESIVRLLKNQRFQDVHDLRNELWLDWQKFGQDCDSKKDRSLLVIDVASNLAKLSLT